VEIATSLFLAGATVADSATTTLAVESVVKAVVVVVVAVLLLVLVVEIIALLLPFPSSAHTLTFEYGLYMRNFGDTLS
jgi:hypothetical protein